MGETRRSSGGPARLARAGGFGVVLVTAGVLVAACSSSSDPVAAPAACGGSAPKLTVQGTGLTTGTPNILTLTVGINVTDAKATAVTAVLALGGVQAKDVQTSGLSINPQYNLHGVITGYQVTNTLTAVLR